MKTSFTIHSFVLFVCVFCSVSWSAVAERKYMKMKHKPVSYRNTTMLSMHAREVDPVTGKRRPTIVNMSWGLSTDYPPNHPS